MIVCPYLDALIFNQYSDSITHNRIAKTDYYSVLPASTCKGLNLN